MTQLGFIVSHVGGTQTAFKLIHNINSFSDRNVKDDVVIFYENLMKPCLKCNFGLFNLTDAWSYQGNVVATNLTTANKMLLFPVAQTKYFYCIDLEWIYIRDKSYEELAHIYQNPHVNLLARSNNHAKQIELAWNRPVRVVEDFKIEQFIKVIEDDRGIKC